jgi:hypothetical protein
MRVGGVHSRLCLGPGCLDSAWAANMFLLVNATWQSTFRHVLGRLTALQVWLDTLGRLQVLLNSVLKFKLLVNVFVLLRGEQYLLPVPNKPLEVVAVGFLELPIPYEQSFKLRLHVLCDWEQIIVRINKSILPLLVNSKPLIRVLCQYLHKSHLLSVFPTYLILRVIRTYFLRDQVVALGVQFWHVEDQALLRGLVRLPLNPRRLFLWRFQVLSDLLDLRNFGEVLGALVNDLSTHLFP